MRKRKFTSLFVSVLIALALFAGVWQPAVAAHGFTNVDAIGNQGIFSPTEFDLDNLFITRASSRMTTGSPVRFARTPIVVHNLGDRGEELNNPIVLTYVFFNLHPWERRAFDDGILEIFFQDPNTGFWNTCPSFLVDDGTGRGRIACVVTTPNTVYGIGTSDLSQVSRILP